MSHVMIWNGRNSYREVPLRLPDEQSSTLRGKFPVPVHTTQADVLGREPDEAEDVDGEPVAKPDEDEEFFSDNPTGNGKRREYNSVSNFVSSEGDTNVPTMQQTMDLILNSKARNPRRTLTDDQRRRIIAVMQECCSDRADKPTLNALSDSDLLKVWSARASSPAAGGLTLNQHALRGGNRVGSAIYTPPTPIADLARERRRELQAMTANDGTDAQYGKPSMGRPGNRATAATSKEASTLRGDATAEQRRPKNSPFADDVVSPLESQEYEDFVPPRRVLSPQEMLDQYVNSVVPEDEMTEGVTPGVLHDTGAIASLTAAALDARQASLPPGMLTGNTGPEVYGYPADPLGLEARRQQLRSGRNPIDCG